MGYDTVPSCRIKAAAASGEGGKRSGPREGRNDKFFVQGKTSEIWVQGKMRTLRLIARGEGTRLIKAESRRDCIL